MVKCSYCESGEHNISSCKEDNDLVELIMNHTHEPKFSSMNEKLLRRLSSQHKIKTTMPKLQLIIQLTRKWRELNTSNKIFTSNDTECAICFETLENTNICITKCGHKYCLTCILQHSDNDTSKKGVNCPMCRTTIYKEKTHIIQSQQDAMNDNNIIQYLESDVLVDLQNMNSRLRDANENIANLGRSFIYDGNTINYYDSPGDNTSEPTYFDINNYLQNDNETTNQFIMDTELVDNLFSEPQMSVEVIREHYRN